MSFNQQSVPSATHRVLRAYEQIKLLRGKVGGMRETRTMPVREQFDPEGGAVYRWTLVTSVIPPPEMGLSVIIGEVIHDLRAALDNLICALAKQHSQSSCERTEFPIFTDPKNFRKRSSELIGGIHPDAQAIVEALQPYHRGQDFQSDPLWMLYELSNIDKHRLFHLTAWVISGATFDLDPGSQIEILEKRVLVDRGMAEYDTPLAYERLRILSEGAVMQVNYQFPLDIAFDQGNTAAPATRVGDVLCTLTDYVSGIVEALARFDPPAIYVAHAPGGFQLNAEYTG